VGLFSAHANAGDDELRWRILALLVVSALGALGDGGKVQLQRKAGAFNITLFSSPSPVRVGRTDFSVMVQSATQASPILDADVRLHFVQRGTNSIAEVSAPARHEKAANKLLYAAPVDLNSTGKWRVEIAVQTARDSALVTGDLDVSPPEPALLAHWPYLIALPIVAFLFALNQRLKKRRRAARQP
jgi:hypothetical protein